MTTDSNRRAFLKTGIASAVALGTVQTGLAAKKKRNITKSLKFGMVSAKGKDKKPLSIQDRFQIAVDAGFDSVEPGTVFKQKDVETYIKASEKTGLKIDGIICSTHWGNPLSDPDPKKVETCMEGMRVSIRNAKDMGGDMVLLVPAVVTPKVTYKEAYERSIVKVRELAEYAESMKITIGLENVWNKFLLSPLEFLRYLDEIGSPYVKAFFDVGNIIEYGYPQGWIRTLGDQIARVDVKDYKRNPRAFTPLLKGDVNWPEVMKAFDEIGYEGVFAAEVQGGNLEYLTDIVSKPMDRIIAM